MKFNGIIFMLWNLYYIYQNDDLGLHSRRTAGVLWVVSRPNFPNASFNSVIGGWAQTVLLDEAIDSLSCPSAGNMLVLTSQDHFPSIFWSSGARMELPLLPQSSHLSLKRSSWCSIGLLCMAYRKLLDILPIQKKQLTKILNALNSSHIGIPT
jgi:hypothetical protein